MGSIEKVDNVVPENKCTFIKQRNYLSGKTYADKLHEKAVEVNFFGRFKTKSYNFT